MFFAEIVVAAALGSSVADTAITIDEVNISASIKITAPMKLLPTSTSLFNMTDVAQNHLVSISDVAASTPNLHIPDYGSKMTSSIYVRGIGSRIDNPSIGMYVDGVPLMNKNSFDADLWDIRRIVVMRGPQGTLFGRNTIGGIISIGTLSPFDYQGTRISMEYGTANSMRASAAHYCMPTNNFGASFGISTSHTDGFFSNRYDNSRCDHENNFAARFKQSWRNLSHWNISNSFSLSYSHQGGYAYSQLDTASGRLLPIAYNDECSYTRTHISDGLVATKKTDVTTIQHVLSWQFLDDDMHLDQDFTTKSMFTLQQKQREHAVTEEFTLRNTDNGQAIWQWLCGAAVFFKHNTMNAPVVFKHDGIQNLILDNANRGIRLAFPADSLTFAEDEFTVDSRFKSPDLGIAAYHQSTINIGNIALAAGLRLDFEHIRFNYKNNIDINYMFSLTMNDYMPLSTTLNGNEQKSFLQLLPKLSVTWSVNSYSNIYLLIAKGYKAGGYNPQMFSDILQNKMKTDLMHSLGIYMDNYTSDYSIKDVISYDPEFDWNFEAGSHWNACDNSISADMAAFYIDCRHQQLTVFPDNKGTGRLMTNAGHTKSYGVELSVRARRRSWRSRPPFAGPPRRCC